ncbi:MAG: hypothetical protein AMJ64_01690 [Betaproteobacteria bacterium SG8_39]|nr:MAG: hypothetical protein AMJ64_01690 [Betaproteobacteria bacterium SG8_39]
MQALRDVLAGLALLALAGCSATQVVYDNGATLLRWRATSYLDVHGAQSKALDQRIEKFLAWHRSAALPKYAALAESCARRVERGLTRADLEWGYDAFRAELDEGLRAAARELAPILDGLTPEQIAHLAQRIEEDNETFAHEQLDGDEAGRRRRRMERNVTRLEEWFGALTATQRDAVRRYTESAPLVGALRAQDRRRRQAELLTILRTRSAQRRLVDWAAGWDRGRAPAYAKASRVHLEAYFDMLLAIDRTLSAEQRAATATRFRRFAQDFEQLARADGREAGR